jgi:hypothetical protein
MAVGSVTIQNLLKHPYVVKVISRQAAPGNPLQSFYGMGMGANASMTLPAGMRAFTYDIFDSTRQIGSIRAPEAGPKRIRRQRVGVGGGHLLRSYEAMNFSYEQIANMRPLGSSIGTLDRTGQAYVTRQIAYASERMKNLREWVLTRMFRGSFTITLSGDDQYVSDSGGQITVDFNHPSANRGSLACGDSDADIIDTLWSNTSADIVSQLLNLNKAAERRTGLPIEHVWINSTTLGYLINNTSLQAAGGAAFRVWETAEWKEMETVDGKSRRRGLDVRFRAIPWVSFHVFDGVLAPGTANVDTILPSSSEVDMVIPNGRAIMTPAPSASWLGFAQGTEIIQKNYNTAPENVVGFTSWQMPTLNPFGRDLFLLDNFFPIPYIPAAWYYATVG